VLVRSDVTTAGLRVVAPTLSRRVCTAGVVLDVSTLVEVLTPLFPAAFLPMAAVANMGALAFACRSVNGSVLTSLALALHSCTLAGKNVAWLSSSATRASIHQVTMR
jgi:hypothetical protein